MPQKVLRFTGINRKVNEFQNSGACEELINLRPDISGGNRVVKDKKVFKGDVEFDLFVEHAWGQYNNHIVVEDGIVYWDNANDVNSRLITNQFERKKVSVSFAGNVLLICCEDDKTQLAFKFEDGKYEPYDITLFPINDVRVSYAKGAVHNAYSRAESEKQTLYDMTEALNTAITNFYHRYPNGLCGASVVGCTYELEDGSEVWSTAFVVANATRAASYNAPTVDVATDENGDKNNTVVVSGTHRVTVHFSFSSTQSDVKKINVYAAKPVFPYELVETGESKFEFREISLDELSLDGQLMYYQGSLNKDNRSIVLNFSSAMTGEKVMDITPGCIERAGEVVSYNNRFHYFRSDVSHVIQVPTISYLKTDTNDTWVAYVKVNDEWKLINNVYRFSATRLNDFIYPLSGIKALRFVKATENERGEINVPYEEMFDVELKDSSAYNYSYAFGVMPSVIRVDDAWYDIIAEQGQSWSYAEANGFTEKVLLEKETNEINVSAPFNPFVFPVNYSYSFGGEIIDIATSYLPISATQIGQYPLTIFTTNGIYAMEQGSGQVLYGNIVPLQPHVIDGKATSTPYGTFFISSKDLYLLSGREAANVSGVLHGDRELNLKEIASYRALCLNEDESELLYDYRYALSDDDENFDVIVSGSRLVYDQYRNELFICSDYNNLRYSYVFNLDTKAYHKVTKKYIAYQNNSRYVIEIDGDTRNVVDLFEERRSTDKPVLLQSRPFSLEEFYSHIHRLIMKTDAELSGKQHLILSVFASDNLYDWKCVISAQKMNTVLRQIRTNRAPKSYKDYVILITGRVDTDTDISDIIADYTVVNRRLG